MFGKRRPNEPGGVPAASETQQPAESQSAARSGSAGRAETSSNRGRQAAAGAYDMPRRVAGQLVPGQRRSDLRGQGHGAEGEGRKLVVGREISLSGEIKACEKLIVEGQVEAHLQDCKTLRISESGLYKGTAVVDEADIRGRFEGDLTVKLHLDLRATGRIEGTLRYAGLQIERGGKVIGAMEELVPPEAAQEDLPETVAESPETAAEDTASQARAASEPTTA
jgi:cytoskeletal protein CcmA (bactofilin family)